MKPSLKIFNKFLLPLSLFFGLSGGLSLSPASAQATLNWRDTGITWPVKTSYVRYCFNGASPNSLFVSQTTPGIEGLGTYQVNWASGTKVLFSPLTFDSCDETNGLLFSTPGEARSTTRYSPSEPQGHILSHKPTHFASDGTLTYYSLTPTPAKPGNNSLYVSLDGGTTWEQRAQQFENDQLEQLLVSPFDARAIYILLTKPVSLPNGYPNGKKYVIYYSGDAGISWEKRSEGEVNGYYVDLRLSFFSASPAPLNYLLLYRSGSPGTPRSAITHIGFSSDGGRTFIEVGEEDGQHINQLFYTTKQLLRYKSGFGNNCEFEASSDGGRGWQGLSLPFPVSKYNCPQLHQNPGAPASLFLTTGYGSGEIWYSADSARSWQKIANKQTWLGLTPYAPTSLLSVGEDNHLYVLDLAGADQWRTTEVVPNGLADNSYWLATAHNLSGSFKQFWEAKGGLAQFGYPRTEPFREVNPADGKIYTVQYFERNRFEYHPENRGTDYEVLLGLLGNQLTATRRASDETPFRRIIDPGVVGVRYFSETGHTLRNQFKAYWEARGGLAIYGYPISEEFEEINPDDGRSYLVQYFERNRFEYHPENKGLQYEVLLGLLGNSLLKIKGWL